MKKMNKKRMLILSAVIVIAAALILLFALPARVAPLPSPSPEPSPVPTSTLRLRPATSRPYARPTAKRYTGRNTGVAVPGWSSIELPADAAEAEVELYNPTDNEGKYYLVFELRLKESGETLFTTGLVPPGSYCNRVTLTHALKAGRYAGVMHVQPVRMSDRSPTNNADVSITINVK